MAASGPTWDSDVMNPPQELPDRDIPPEGTMLAAVVGNDVSAIARHLALDYDLRDPAAAALLAPMLIPGREAALFHLAAAAGGISRVGNNQGRALLGADSPAAARYRAALLAQVTERPLVAETLREGMRVMRRLDIACALAPDSLFVEPVAGRDLFLPDGVHAFAVFCADGVLREAGAHVFDRAALRDDDADADTEILEFVRARPAPGLYLEGERHIAAASGPDYRDSPMLSLLVVFSRDVAALEHWIERRAAAPRVAAISNALRDDDAGCAALIRAAVADGAAMDMGWISSGANAVHIAARRVMPCTLGALLAAGLQGDSVQHLSTRQANPLHDLLMGYCGLDYPAVRKDVRRQHAAEDLRVCLDLLLRQTPWSIDACSSLGLTPLHIAAKSAAPEAVALLLDRGADPSLRTLFDQRTALELAADGDTRAVFQAHANRARMRQTLDSVATTAAAP